MPSYRLVTPQKCGLVGTTKVLFALAGVEYELVKLSAEEMQKEKGRMPFGQLPILEFDGKTIAQSRAVARYVAKEYGLYGKDNYDQARADMIVDQIYDVVERVKVWAKEQDPDKKAGFADATFLSISQRWKLINPNCLDGYPKLTALNSRLLSLPKVAEYLKA
uniref:Hematopoietic prostaglandin D synthase-like n=1 Tax=Saccoglossus kowalevskii TaxID=10224 RepID=A0ABM0LZ80_SACKO|nr:PREDICTED: hematopoietic prostaglandin D synthase-like [Saccoglossus kowalevskii]